MAYVPPAMHVNVLAPLEYVQSVASVKLLVSNAIAVNVLAEVNICAVVLDTLEYPALTIAFPLTYDAVCASVTYEAVCASATYDAVATVQEATCAEPDTSPTGNCADAE